MSSPTIYFDLGDTLIHGPPDNRVPFADAVATLAELHSRGYLLGLLSNQANGTTVAQVNTRIDGYGFGQYIDPVTISSELPGNVFKPDPQIFALALQKAGFAAASSEVIFVTETLSHITAARALGWRAILKRNGSTCIGSDGECVESLDALLDVLPPLDIDLWFRDATDHTGPDQYPGPRFWESPDLWVRNSNDGGTTHEEPEFGQDNWFHAGVRNRGVGIARSFQVSFEVKPWAGTNFVYPGDYFPAIAFAGGNDLAPGDSTVLRARWPADRVPPTDTHACWVSAIMVSGDLSPAGRRVWEHNNLAQKNLSVVNLIAGDSITIPFRFANRLGKVDRFAHLEIRRPRGWLDTPVALVATGARSMQQTWAASVKPTTGRVVQPLERLGPEIEFLAPAEMTVRARPGAAPIRLDLAAKSVVSSLAVSDVADAVDADETDDVWRPAAKRPETHNAMLARAARGATEIEFGGGATAGINTVARARRAEQVGVRITAPSYAKPGDQFTIDIVERDEKNRVIGGISVRTNVVAP